jgi:hypothetical protein
LHTKPRRKMEACEVLLCAPLRQRFCNSKPHPSPKPAR